MFADEYEFYYNRIVKDIEELYEYADYSDEYDYDYDESYCDNKEPEYEHYYHTIMDEVDID
jgi:hypothetical protein